MPVKIDVTSPKTGRNIELETDFSESLNNEELKNNAAIRMWSQDFGNAARRFLNNPAITVEAVVEKMKSWKPGIAMPRMAGVAKDPVGAFIAKLGTMSPEEVAKEMQRIKDAIAEKKAGK